VKPRGDIPTTTGDAHGAVSGLAPSQRSGSTKTRAASGPATLRNGGIEMTGVLINIVLIVIIILGIAAIIRVF
jgi:hypothetical protein